MGILKFFFMEASRKFVPEHRSPNIVKFFILLINILYKKGQLLKVFEVFIMPDKKKEKKEYEIFPVVPVGKSRAMSHASQQTINAEASGNTRVSPESRSEASRMLRCMICNYKSPDEYFHKHGIFQGCPECHNVNREWMVEINEDGTRVDKTKEEIPDFQKFVDKKMSVVQNRIISKK